VSQLGDTFQFVAIMWFAVATGGPLGVIAVRIGNTLPALLFGLQCVRRCASRTGRPGSFRQGAGEARG
jgi:hypothetical protein